MVKIITCTDEDKADEMLANLEREGYVYASGVKLTDENYFFFQRKVTYYLHKDKTVTVSYF